jgi:hypothetical protein
MPDLRRRNRTKYHFSSYLSNGFRRKGAKPRSPVPRSKSKYGSGVATTALSNCLIGRNLLP